MNYLYYKENGKEVIINMDNVNYITQSPNSNLADVTFANGDTLLTNVDFEEMKSTLASMMRKITRIKSDDVFKVKVVNK